MTTKAIDLTQRDGRALTVIPDKGRRTPGVQIHRAAQIHTPWNPDAIIDLTLDQARALAAALTRALKTIEEEG